MNEEILTPYLRIPTDEDRATLPRFSHSKLETFKNCPMSYNLKYNEKKTSDDTSIALELGSLCHLILELKGRALVDNKVDKINYRELDNILQNGYNEVNEKTTEHLLGVQQLHDKYWDTWDDPDSEGKTYRGKLKIFDKVLHSEMEDSDEWSPWLFEHHFEFVWDNKCIVNGFIDRVDRNKDGDIRVVDYKTSKKVFDKSKLPTSQQFAIYACAMLLETGKLPIEYLYRFIFLNQSQNALTKGWEKRFVKALNNTLDNIQHYNTEKIWTPKASPLCYFCNYSKTNPNASRWQEECEYYSMWTPTKKDFSVNKKWNIFEQEPSSIPMKVVEPKVKRKIVF